MAAALLIDDDADLLRTISENAAEEGFELHTAESWEEGLAAFQTVAPDLVVADYNLPGSRHGLRLLLEIKRLRPSVRVVLISGVVNPDELARVESLDVVDRVVSKGSSMDAIRVLIDEIRDASKRRDQPTDWQTFGQAYIENRALDDKLIDELDDRLRTDAERQA